MLPAGDHLDLDWAPDPLMRLGRLTSITAAAEAAISKALSDSIEVNPAYREHQDTIWGHPVTYLEQDDVAEVASGLAAIDAPAVIGGLPRWNRRINSRLFDGQKASDPKHYLLQHLAALRTFYSEAAQAGRAVVLWWD
ncbi:hypothetical protein Kisp02_46900 [Kineosporia sp. NBRC 101731]|nr:hypothetical protein Kisp02_46900 [Kineosporia sp. NBRC 101731]